MHQASGYSSIHIHTFPLSSQFFLHIRGTHVHAGKHIHALMDAVVSHEGLGLSNLEVEYDGKCTTRQGNSTFVDRQLDISLPPRVRIQRNAIVPR